jgi:hypothetical protein
MLVKKIAAPFIFVVCLWSIAAKAEDVTNSFTLCATTDDDRKRLACYDKIRDTLVKQSQTDTSKQKASQYQPMDLVDLKTDIKTLRGKKVDASGMVQIMGEMVFLKSDALDMTPVMVETGNISRDERKALLQKCASFCQGQVLGVVRSGALGPELAADHVVIK